MSEKITLLIVDDHEANLISLDALLGSDERVIITAQSGKEALEIMSRERVDLVLLDVQMPDMNGFELAQTLKSRKETSGVPILFASAEKLDHASRMQGFAEGAIDYLLKPLDPDITRAKVQVLLDVQRQKRQLLEKNAQLEKSALLIGNSADILGVADAATLAIEEMNPAFTVLLGFAPEEYINRCITDFLDPAHRKLVWQLVEDTSERFSFQALVHSKEGISRWLDWNIVVRNGKWFIDARDITEVRDLTASLERNVLQLEATNRELESFSYSVSHDLRAPLRAVHGNALILEEDFAGQLGAEGMRYVKKVQDNARRMDGLINDLLAFSRLGKKPLSKSSVQMDALVREVVSEVSQFQSHKAKVEVEDLPEVYGDPTMLRQVWTNLISNAIKYSSKKPEPLVRIGSRKRANEIEYFIEDNGAGFDMAYAKKLFGTFQRLHDHDEFEGTGIGLAIVQRIILRHGGIIQGHGTPDAGARFWFRLPVYTSKEAGQAAGR